MGQSRFLRLTSAIFLTFAMTGCGTSTSLPSTGQSVKVGVFLISEGVFVNQVVQGFKDGFTAASGLPKDEVVWVEKNALGDQTQIQTIARYFAESDVSMIAVLGTPAVIALAQVEKTKPIIAIAMGDPVGAGVARSLDRPGGNVTGSTDFVEPSLILRQLLRIRPSPRIIGTVYDPANENMQVWVTKLRAAVAQAKLQLQAVGVNAAGDVPAAARLIAGESNALLIGPDALVAGAGLPAVAEAARAARIPMYTLGGDVSLPGIFASIGPDYPELGRLAGEVAARVHSGSSPAVTAFGRPQGLDFTINSGTQHTLDLSVPSDILAKARVVAS